MVRAGGGLTDIACELLGAPETLAPVGVVLAFEQQE
jgi:hypothetical protein